MGKRILHFLPTKWKCLLPNDTYTHTTWLQLQNAQVRELEVKCEETRPVSKAKETLDQIAKRECETFIIAGV